MSGLSLSMGMRQEIRPEMRQEIKLSLSLAVITPSGICPKCNHQLTEDEIQSGWRQDPNDLTTECPKCHTRFPADLRIESPSPNEGQSGSNAPDVVMHPYYCPIQLKNALRLVVADRGRLGLVYLMEHRPALVWNMVKHHGTYDKARQEFQRWLKEHPVDPFMRRDPPPVSNPNTRVDLVEVIVNTIAEKPDTDGIKSSEIAEILGIPQYQILRNLLQLEELGHIVRYGRTRGTHWFLG